MTAVNHRDTETQRTHRNVCCVWIHPDVQVHQTNRISVRAPCLRVSVVNVRHPSGKLQPRVFRAQRLLADRETHDDLRVVVERLDADHGADAELRVTHARARHDAAAAAGGLVLVLVGRKRRRGLAHTGRGSRRRVDTDSARGTRRGPAGAAEAALVLGAVVGCLLDQLGRDLIEESRRVGGLVLAKRAPSCGPGQHQPLPRPRHPDVTQPPLFLELAFVLERA